MAHIVKSISNATCRGKFASKNAKVRLRSRRRTFAFFRNSATTTGIRISLFRYVILNSIQDGEIK